MNRVFLVGRLTKDPDIRVTQNGTGTARFTLAVDRKTKEPATDFISCVAFGKTAEFYEKYVTQGMKMVVAGHIQTGSYTNKDGQRVYTTDVIVDESEFAESKRTESKPVDNYAVPEFMDIPDDGVPFN